MIGDRSHDIVGARANRLRSAGVLWGYGFREELVASEPGALFETIDALPAAFASGLFAELL